MRNRNTYLTDIDGLRAIAVTAVIAYHYDSTLIPNGFLGVDIFFVVSGFVISKSITQYEQKTLGSLLMEFYSNRIKRLLPALILCVFITGIFACIFVPKPSQTLATGITALFGLSNLYLYTRSTDYFGESAASNFFTHTWSLGIEEQFYFIYPFLFFAMVKIVNQKVLFYTVLIVLTAVSLGLYLYSNSRYPNAAFFLLPFRLWELAAGALMYFLITNKNTNSLPSSKYFLHILICSLLVVLFFPLPSTALATTTIVIVTCAILFFIANQECDQGSILSSVTFRHIGLISYSLYLWHWSIIVLAYWTIGISTLTTPLLLLSTYFVSVASYYYVEQPLRRKSWSKNNIVTASYGITAALFTSVLLYVLLDGKGTPSSIYAASSNNGQWTANSLIIEAIKNNNGSPINEHNVDVIYNLESFYEKRKRCHMTPHRLAKSNLFYREKPLIDEAFLDNCSRTNARQVLIVGDSFASVVADHIYLAATKHGLEANILYGYGCPYPLNPDNINLERNLDCDPSSTSIQLAITRNLKRNDLLVVRAFFQGYGNNADVSAYDSEIRKIVEIVKSKQAHLLLIGTNAVLTRSMPCTVPRNFNSLQCPSDKFNFPIDTDPLNRFTVSLNKHFQNKYAMSDEPVTFLDPIQLLCSAYDNKCPAYGNGVLYYQENDFNHLSSAAVDLLFSDLDRALQNISEK